MSEGSILDLRTIRPSSNAKKLAKTYQMEPTFVEVVIRESDVIFGGLPGFLLTVFHSIHFSLLKICDWSFSYAQE